MSSFDRQTPPSPSAAPSANDAPPARGPGARLDAAVSSLYGDSSALDRFSPLRRFGWAFLLAWVFCVFYTDVIDGYARAVEAASLGPAGRLLFAVLPVLSSIVMLVLIVALEPRLGSPAQHASLFLVAPLVSGLATPLLYAVLPVSSASLALFVAGAVLTGTGSAFLWVMWGEYYARVTQEEAEFLAPVSAVLAAVVVLAVSAMSGWIAVAVATSLPLLSGLCLALSWRAGAEGAGAAEYRGELEQRAFRQAHEAALSSLPRVVASMGRAGFGIFASFVFVCLSGSFWEVPSDDASGVQFAFVVGVVFLVGINALATAGPRRVSLSFLYRWMCPALVVGFVAIILWGEAGGTYVAYVVAIVCRFVFCLITQMYFARYAVAGLATPTQSYGLGWIFLHSGDFAGVLVLAAVEQAQASGAATLTQAAAVSIAVLVAVTMFVLNDERSFSFGVRSDAPSPGGAGRLGASGEGADASGASRLPEAADAPDEATPAAARRASAGAQPEPASAQPEPVDELTARIRTLAREGGLTPRETEVFDLLARGRSIPYVRDALIISRETAATHAKHIYAKLGVHSRQELIDLVL